MAPLRKRRQFFWRSLLSKLEYKQLDRARYLAVSVALIYAGISILWIAYSDRLLVAWSSSVEILTKFQTLKGWFFVGCTSLLLYKLIQQGVQQLQQKHQLLEDIINSTNDAIFVKDIRGRYLVINKMGAKLLGVHPGDVLGKVDEQFFTAEAAQQIRSMEATIFKTGQPAIEVEELLTINEEARWFSTTKNLCLNARCRPIGIVGVARDITQRKQVEEELQRSEQLRAELKLLENILEVIFAGYWHWDIPGNQLYYSSTWKRMFGYADHELPNSPETWQRLIFAEDLPIVMADLNHHIQNREAAPFSNEVRYHHKNGSTVWVRCSGRVIEWDADGNPLRAIGCYINITHRKQVEEQLRLSNESISLANAELARATRLKDEFLANMSHELRTPLTSILGMSEMLKEEIYGSLTEKQHQYIEVISQSGNHLLNLINDILDLAKIESGKLTLEIVPTSIATLCNSSLNFVKQIAYQKNIKLETQISTNLGDIDVDELRIRQALINLLSNAVKFTPVKGQVRLEVKHDSTQNFIHFSVIDTGIGIATEDIPKLFQSFVQIDSKLNRQYSGTGLGLALVKQIAELHQGTIAVTSTIGQGSCFTLTLPSRRSPLPDPSGSASTQIQAIPPGLNQPSPPASQESPPQAPKALSTQPLILLAEDNQANIDTFSTYLTSLGFRLIIATDGQEAIDLARAHQPDVILMDIQMPGVDGLEATRRIRADRTLAHIPIIALTALAMTGDRENCLAAGVTEYLAKPVSLKQLVNSIQQLLSLPKRS